MIQSRVVWAAVQILLVSLGCVAAVDCGASHTIASPSDATDLGAACPTIQGDVLIAAGGEIDLDGVERIEGRLAVVASSSSSSSSNTTEGSCSSSSSSSVSSYSTTTTAATTSSSSSSSSDTATCEAEDDTDDADTGTITRISAANLSYVGGGIEIPASGASAPDLRTIELPALRAVRGGAGVRVSGLPALDTLDLGLLDVVGAGDEDDAGGLTVADAPQLYYLALPLTRSAGDVTVAGNGNLVLQLGGIAEDDDDDNDDDDEDDAVQSIPNLYLSGLGELRWGGPQDTNNITVAGTVAVRDGGGLSTLPLLFGSVGGLEVQDNTHLSEILFPSESAGLVSRLRDIVVTGNDILDLTTIHTATWNGSQMQSWVWPGEDMDTVVLNGTIHLTFFQPLFDAHQYTSAQTANSSKPRVLEDFEVTSSVSGFQCDPIDEMRRRRIFPGNYSCNGDTIEMISGALGIGSGRTGSLALLFLMMVAGLSILL